MHRYDYGEFWPNLRQGDYDYIGEKDGKGFNINVPLNKVEFLVSYQIFRVIFLFVDFMTNRLALVTRSIQRHFIIFCYQ